MGRSGSGVETRDSSIRIKFVLNGETIRERVTINGKSLEPTPPNIKYAHRLAAEIKRRIELGNFNFTEFFPDSARAKTESHEATTFGKLADLWLWSPADVYPRPQKISTVQPFAYGKGFWVRTL